MIISGLQEHHEVINTSLKYEQFSILSVIAEKEN